MYIMILYGYVLFLWMLFMPAVSIIIPVYNTEKYLQRCLDSVLNQTFSDLEIICVNDGSTDNSLNLLQNYAQHDKRIKIVTQTNQGLSQARNNGMLQASGKYFCFLDSDDFLDDNFIECLYKKAEKEKADVVMTGTRHISKTKITMDYLFEGVLSSFCDRVKSLPHGGACNKLYSRDFLNKYHLTFPAGLYFEDNPFTIQVCYFANKFVTIHGGCYNYVSNGLSITQDPQKEQKRLTDGLIITKKIMDFTVSYHLPPRERKVVSDFCLKYIINHRKLAEDNYRLDVLSLIERTKTFYRLYSKIRLKAIRKNIKNFFARLLGIKTKKSA